MHIATDSQEHADWLSKNVQSLLKNSNDCEVTVHYKPNMASICQVEQKGDTAVRFELRKQDDSVELSPSSPQ